MHQGTCSPCGGTPVTLPVKGTFDFCLKVQITPPAKSDCCVLVKHLLTLMSLRLIECSARSVTQSWTCALPLSMWRGAGWPCQLRCPTESVSQFKDSHKVSTWESWPDSHHLWRHLLGAVRVCASCCGVTRGWTSEAWCQQEQQWQKQQQ